MTELININSAPVEDLTTLTGVGPAMADRIVAARPFESIDDLRQIRGVGPALLDRLSSLITIADPASPDETIFLDVESGTPPEAGEASSETETPSQTESIPPDLEGEPIPPWDRSESESEITESEIPMPKEKAIVPVESDEEEPEKKSDGPKPITWGQVLMLVGVSSLASFVLAVFLSLGILSSINGGLRFSSIEEVNTLSTQAEALDLQLSTLGDDISSLRTRLDNLEGIGNQVNELEIFVEEIDTELALTTDTVAEMNRQIEEIQDSTTTFQLFLDGLTDLMDNLSPDQEAP
jgi:competence ComEA-like helix-hairpin-helix protein